MLQFQQSRFTKMVPERLATGTVLSEEGQALVANKENGELVVVPSTGAAGELFAGVSIIRNAPPAAVPVVEDDNPFASQGYDYNNSDSPTSVEEFNFS